MEKELTFDEMTKALEIGTAKNQFEKSLEDIKQGQGELLSVINNSESKDVFKEKLEQYDLATLTVKVKDNNFIDSILTDENGNPMDITGEFSSKDREYEFKRDFILYFKSSQEYEHKIDNALESINNDYKEFETDMENICNTMSDNMLAFVEELKEKSLKLNGKEREKAELHIDHIESAYNMSIFLKVIDTHPSIITNTLREFNNTVLFNDVISKYEKLCSKAKVEPIFSNIIKKERMSFEERFLVPGSYTRENLFMFILIRYFVTNKIQGLELKLHSALSVCIRNIYRDRMIDNVKDRFLSSITTLVNKY